jgi:nucleoside-diphosphate-sugar epimerase
MDILVTGGSGFVPSNILRRLAQSGHTIVSIDVTPPGETLLKYLGDLTKRITFVEGDICNASVVAGLGRDHHIDAIVHAAVITAVNPAIEPQDPTRTIDVNVMGTTRILDLARSLKQLRRFIYISSSGVYGTTKDQNVTINEDYPVNLPTLYAITKYASENIVGRYCELYGFSGASIRIGAPYGPMDHKTWARNERNVVCDIIDHAINDREIVLTAGGLAFERDWTFIDDTVAGIEAALNATRLTSNVYNLSSGRSQSIEAIILAAKKRVPGTRYRITADTSEVNINLISGKPRGPLGIELIRRDAGFEPRVGLDDGVARFIDWWREYHAPDE